MRRAGLPIRSIGKQRSRVISEHGQGLDLLLHLDLIDEQTAERMGRRLRELLEALDARHEPA